MSCVSGLPKNYNGQNITVSQKPNVIPPKYQPPPSPNRQYNAQLSNYSANNIDRLKNLIMYICIQIFKN